MYNNIIKRVLDALVAIVGFTLLLPVFVFITFFLLVVNAGKPFFFQRRPGRHGKIFEIIKFKTMNDKKDVHGELLPDAQRLTAIGKFVRATSLDEMPQLLNVIKGDMSLVGPRPLLPEYLSLYSSDQQKRHEVKPGITGWAQVNGRNAISWTRKLELDTWYIENQSFWLDLRILQMTVKKVILKKDINTEGQATTEPFDGTN